MMNQEKRSLMLERRSCLVPVLRVTLLHFMALRRMSWKSACLTAARPLQRADKEQFKRHAVPFKHSASPCKNSAASF